MKLTDESKRDMLSFVIRQVAFIADKECQKKVWIRCVGPECYAYDDMCCDFFPTCDSVIEDYKHFGVTENQCVVLKKFRNEFEDFSDEYSDWPSEFINTPEWEEITEMAKEVLKAFNYRKPLR